MNRIQNPSYCIIHYIGISLQKWMKRRAATDRQAAQGIDWLIDWFIRIIRPGSARFIRGGVYSFGQPFEIRWYDAITGRRLQSMMCIIILILIFKHTKLLLLLGDLKVETVSLCYILQGYFTMYLFYYCGRGCCVVWRRRKKCVYIYIYIYIYNVGIAFPESFRSQTNWERYERVVDGYN